MDGGGARSEAETWGRQRKSRDLAVFSRQPDRSMGRGEAH